MCITLIIRYITSFLCTLIHVLYNTCTYKHKSHLAFYYLFDTRYLLDIYYEQWRSLMFMSRSLKTSIMFTL